MGATRPVSRYPRSAGAKVQGYQGRIKAWAKFRRENKLTTVCSLLVDIGNGNCYEFTARAKCNTEAGDAYDYRTGQELALRRATKKYTDFMVRYYMTAAEKITESHREVSDKLLDRLVKNWKAVDPDSEPVIPEEEMEAGA